MAKSNKITMPSGMGGLTRFSDEYKSKVSVKPGHVIIICAVVVILLIILHLQGAALLGI